MGFMSTMKSITGYGGGGSKKSAGQSEQPEEFTGPKKSLSAFGKVKKAYGAVQNYGRSSPADRPRRF